MTEKNYVLNIKNPKGTIFTFRGDTATELENNLLSFVNGDLSQTIVEVESIIFNASANAAVETVQQAFGGQVVAETPLPPAGAQFAPVPPPVAPTQTVTGARTCAHGPMIGRKGNGAKGEWKGMFCPTPKGTAGQCDPVWLTRKDAEWATI